MKIETIIDSAKVHYKEEGNLIWFDVAYNYRDENGAYPAVSVAVPLHNFNGNLSEMRSLALQKANELIRTVAASIEDSNQD